jgi:phosphate/sulfate permease
MDPDITIILVGLAMVFGFYMAWNIGANDLANAMGTSVGSGALTLMGAVVLAGVMEFFGAFLVGPHVSETVRKGIVDLSVFADDPHGPTELACGMLAALLAAGVWLQVASYFGWPVSTTHSIVGAIVGFGAIYGGMGAVNWFGDGDLTAIVRGRGGVASIVASWVVSPLLSGVIAFVTFRLVVLEAIFHRPDPVAAARRLTPCIVFCVVTVLMLVLGFKGLGPFWANFELSPFDPLPLSIALGTAFGGATIGALVSGWLAGRIVPADIGRAAQLRRIYVGRALSKAVMHLRRVEYSAAPEARARAGTVLGAAEQLLAEVRGPEDGGAEHSAYQDVERIFVYLQILSAGFVAFAHGANDVANAIGPLSVVVQIAQTGAIPVESAVPLWALALGGFGIVIGLATWGWRVIQTIGKRITELTPSRGFCAEFAAATTILLASVYKLPISTTHTLVGGVLGVGLAGGIGALNMTTVRDIGVSWLVTIPAGAGLAILFYGGLRFVLL